MHIPETNALEMLQEKGISISKAEDPEAKDYFLTVTFDRGLYQPCVISSFSIGGESAHNHARLYRLNYNANRRIDFNAAASDIMPTILSEFRIPTASSDASAAASESISQILSAMIDIFEQKEASSLTTRVTCGLQGRFEVIRANFQFDDAAQKSGRHEDIKAMRDTSEEKPEEVEAEKDGIVYVK